MTKQEYNDYIEALKARGYNFGGSWYNKPYYSKVIGYREDEDGNRRAVCQLIFNCCEIKSFVSGYVYYPITSVVVVSRNIDERLRFTIGLTKQSIEECERIAKEFLRWVDNNINEYQDNEK